MGLSTHSRKFHAASCVIHFIWQLTQFYPVSTIRRQASSSHPVKRPLAPVSLFRKLLWWRTIARWSSSSLVYSNLILTLPTGSYCNYSSILSIQLNKYHIHAQNTTPGRHRSKTKSKNSKVELDTITPPLLGTTNRAQFSFHGSRLEFHVWTQVQQKFRASIECMERESNPRSESCFY
jgi:hypothetical protein